MPGESLYTALGNCIPAGAGGLLICTPYVQYYRRRMERALGTPLRVRNYGHLFGIQTAGIVDLLENDPDLRYDLRHSSVVTFNIGDNDMLRGMREHEAGDAGAMPRIALEFSGLYRRMVDRILELVPRGQAIIRTFNIYNPWPDHQLAPWVGRFNQIIERTSARGSNSQWRPVPMADVYTAFRNGPLRRMIGLDGMHPSYSGHMTIAELLAELGTQPA